MVFEFSDSFGGDGDDFEERLRSSVCWVCEAPAA